MNLLRLLLGPSSIAFAFRSAVQKSFSPFFELVNFEPGVSPGPVVSLVDYLTNVGIFQYGHDIVTMR